MGTQQPFPCHEMQAIQQMGILKDRLYKTLLDNGYSQEQANAIARSCGMVWTALAASGFLLKGAEFSQHEILAIISEVLLQSSQSIMGDDIPPLPVSRPLLS